MTQKTTPIVIVAIAILSGCAYDYPPYVSPVLLSHQVQVKDSDTLYSIAYFHGVSTRSLIRENKLSPPYTVRYGQVLLVPASPPVVVSPDFHPSPSKKFLVAKEPKLSPAPLPHKAPPRLDVSKNNKKPSPFVRPIEGGYITKPLLGPSRPKEGVRIASALNTPIRAIAKGVVMYTGNEVKNLGNLILIQHDNDWISIYGSVHQIKVKKGDSVKQCQIIATVGQTAQGPYPHLYFELRKDKKIVDPLSHLPS